MEDAIFRMLPGQRIGPRKFGTSWWIINCIQHKPELTMKYKDVREDEFWVRGHMPDYPLLPGVLMCEAAAQLCCYYNVDQKVNDPGVLLGLGGIEDTRFHRPVRPGDRLVLVGKATRLNRRQTVFNVQGFVGPRMAFHADVIGVPLSRKEGP